MSEQQRKKDLVAASNQTLMVELQYESCPTFNVAELLERIRPLLPKTIHMNQGLPDQSIVVFAHEGHPVHFKDGDIPAQTVIMPASESSTPDIPEDVFAQTRNWPQARDVVQKTRHQVLLTEMMARPLPYRDRLTIFQVILNAILETTAPLAIYWPTSSKLTDPKAFIMAFNRDGSQTLHGTLNVRLYNISNHPGVMLMDSVGLAVFGLPDMQCHFRNLEPGRMAGILFGTASYIFEKGDVIQDGHTIEGFGHNPK